MTITQFIYFLSFITSPHHFGLDLNFFSANQYYLFSFYLSKANTGQLGGGVWVEFVCSTYTKHEYHPFSITTDNVHPPPPPPDGDIDKIY